MRNVDKIRVLENKLEHERNLVQKLRRENAALTEGSLQIRQMIDAVMIEIVKRYGVETREDGELLGIRLATGKADVKECLENWEIRVADQGDDRVICILPREQKEEQHGNEQP